MTDMDMTGIGADDRVLSENTVPPSSAAHAMPEVQVVTEEDMELEADFDDVYCDCVMGMGHQVRILKMMMT